jgi:RNA polymerase sigma-70 factor (ECF subfamily)
MSSTSTTLRPAPHVATVIPLRRPRTSQTLDDRKMESLYLQYGQSVFRYVRTLTMGDEHLAEDITQETFLRAWRTPDLIVDGPVGCRSWLTTVARNLVVDRLRRRQRRPQEAGDEALPMVAAAGCDMDRVVTSLTVWSALAKLTPARRQVLVELYFRGRSLSEVADELGIPIGTVKSRAHYALRALRQYLQEHPEAESGTEARAA